MMDIEQLTELEPDKTYYLRIPADTSDSDMTAFNKSIDDLILGCTIIVGRGEYNIEQIEDNVGDDWGTIL